MPSNLTLLLAVVYQPVNFLPHLTNFITVRTLQLCKTGRLGGPFGVTTQSTLLQKRWCHSSPPATVKVLAAQGVLSMCFGLKKSQWLFFMILGGYFVAGGGHSGYCIKRHSSKDHGILNSVRNELKEDDVVL